LKDDDWSNGAKEVIGLGTLIGSGDRARVATINGEAVLFSPGASLLRLIRFTTRTISSSVGISSHTFEMGYIDWDVFAWWILSSKGWRKHGKVSFDCARGRNLGDIVCCGGIAVTRLVGSGNRQEVTASGMKVRRRGIVDLHGGQVRKRFDGGIQL
jgi:hypothetical protein